MIQVEQIAADAKKAAMQMGIANEDKKNTALEMIITELIAHKAEIYQVNQTEIDQAKNAGMDPAMVDRLCLVGRLEGVIEDIKNVIKLPDPVGECIEEQRTDCLEIRKYRTPVGVLGVIYESRPNVTLDVSALAIKSGNCAILRGGSESIKTNIKLVECIQNALGKVNLPKSSIQLVSNPDRSEVYKLLRLDQSIDMIIPRGGAKLHRFCRENSTIPVITGGIGICHLFMDESADFEKSLRVITNAKVQRPTVCNALDTLLVHRKIAESFIPRVIDSLRLKGVQFRLDEFGFELMHNLDSSSCYLAGPDDWDTEWLSLILGVKVVEDIHEAVEHISKHSSGHSDGILTENQEHAQYFCSRIDSAAVYVNASTRFTDGAQLGLGSEVAISTQKLHARGPMGLRELTSYKWIICGDYAVRK